MIIKEYRIPFPVSLEEYKIAHLYMVAKKSCQESASPESGGVQILANEPYTEGPGGNGQFTHKMYYFGAYLPACLRPLMKETSRVHERSWNAYPYTRTIYASPRMEKFSIRIDTIYDSSCIVNENIFQLSEEELSQRIIDYIDIANDPCDDVCKPEEDPKIFCSMKTGRGPESLACLHDLVQGRKTVADIQFMYVYKLCRVEFKYCFIQSKVEKWIQDNVLRKNILRGCRQVWVWQDEWHGWTMDDIRKLEAETQSILLEKMDQSHREATDEGEEEEEDSGSEAFDSDVILSNLDYLDIMDTNDEGDTAMAMKDVECAVEAFPDCPEDFTEMTLTEENLPMNSVHPLQHSPVPIATNSALLALDENETEDSENTNNRTAQ